MSKVKYPSAEAKRTAERLAIEWEQLKNKQYKSNSMLNSCKPVKKVFKMYDVAPNMGTSRATSNAATSRVTAGGSTALKATQTYTGDKMIGVTILHKSCLQPVFNQQEAIDAASMRR